MLASPRLVRSLGSRRPEFHPGAGSKASEYWIFCRLPIMSRRSYFPLPIVRAFAHRFSSAYLLLRLSAVECLASLADGLAYYAVC